jgi:hypothetical protein
MLATPINEFLLNTYFELPQYLGTADQVSLVTEAGRRFADVDGTLKEVVIATSADVSNVPVPAQPGVYVVGTGSTGAAKTFFTLGAGYLVSMNIGAFMQRVPREGWTPPNWVVPTDDNRSTKMISSGNVHHNEALKTPQFYMLWTSVACYATAGVSVIACAKTMMTDIFAAALPAIVTGAFAASYVAALSGANMAGRLFWANASDMLSRKRTYLIFGLVSVPVLGLMPELTSATVANPSAALLGLFYGSTAVIVSFYGGVFAVLPAYISDMFGQKHVGAIHGRLLTAWSAAAIGGPNVLTTLRSGSHEKAITDLAATVDPGVFERSFGAPVTDLASLIATKTVTIPQLMEIVPSGVVDPSPTLYNTTLYAMAGLAAVAMASNAMMKPVNKKHYIQEEPKL